MSTKRISIGDTVVLKLRYGMYKNISNEINGKTVEVTAVVDGIYGYIGATYKGYPLQFGIEDIKEVFNGTGKAVRDERE